MLAGVAGTVAEEGPKVVAAAKAGAVGRANPELGGGELKSEVGVGV